MSDGTPFPDEATASPQSANKIEITRYNELVVLHVQKPQEYLPFPAVSAVHTALRMLATAVEADKRAAQLVIDGAMLIVDHVYEVHGDLKPVNGALRHELIERHRKTLNNRIALMLNSTRENKQVSNRKLAQQIVDVVCGEVFS